MKRTIVAVVAAVALGASGAKKLIFVGWDTGDLTPAEIVRNAEALYEAGADGVGIYPRFKAEKENYIRLFDVVMTSARLAVHLSGGK